MDSPKSPSGSTRRHNRIISHPLPRRSTRGPLDADDPLSPQPVQTPPLASPSSSTPTEQADPDITLPEPQLVPPPKRSIPLDIDLHFLKDTSRYHHLDTSDIPQSFLDSPNQPPSDTPLSSLLQNGHFRRAAGTSLIELARCRADDAERIFQLLYTRLACLVLISRADLAAVEAAPLTDLLARNAPGAEKVAEVMPWELRVLLVRLLSIAAADGGRRGIMALYALSAEVRGRVREARSAGEEGDVAIWSERLRSLGLQVADTLVEMGELETATRHLDSLQDGDGDELAYRKALLRLRVGDVSGAKRSTAAIQDETRRDTLTALLAVANGDTASATKRWETLSPSLADDASFPSNLAVGMLYAGNMVESRRLLEELREKYPAFPGLLFNLGTVYELSSDRAGAMKSDLAERLAAKDPVPSTGGWERANFEFKL